MAQNNQYGPDAYKRLELVRKQFQSNVAQQNKQKPVERNQNLTQSLSRHKIMIARLTVYAIMAMISIAVITTAISEVLSK
jgi:hypothetical protein